ncbi:MAG: LysR family transcriptional regulator [Pseudomonadota bacterium]
MPDPALEDPAKPVPLLDLDLLRTLVAIAQTQNFSTAAAVVHRTPSAVSMQVKRIEELVGRSIIERSSRSVTLNEHGELLLAHARRVLALNQNILSKFVEPAETGIVRLGAGDHFTEQHLPNLLCQFRDLNPGIQVDVVVDNATQMADAFRRDQLDIALIGCTGPRYDGLDVEIICEEALVWAGARNGVAYEQTPLPISVWEEGCEWRRVALDGLEKQARDYRVTLKSAYIAGQRAGVSADLAIAPIPRSACHGAVVELPADVGLPALPNCMSGMIVKDNPSAAVNMLANRIRALQPKQAA